MHRLDLPPGSHDVWILTGDATQPSDPTYVGLAGTQLAASTPLAAGQFSWLQFTVPGGWTDLQLSGESTKHWHLNALVVT